MNPERSHDHPLVALAFKLEVIVRLMVPLVSRFRKAVLWLAFSKLTFELIVDYVHCSSSFCCSSTHDRGTTCFSKVSSVSSRICDCIKEAWSAATTWSTSGLRSARKLPDFFKCTPTNWRYNGCMPGLEFGVRKHVRITCKACKLVKTCIGDHQTIRETWPRTWKIE